jgi:hypothetical protein
MRIYTYLRLGGLGWAGGVPRIVDAGSLSPWGPARNPTAGETNGPTEREEIAQLDLANRFRKARDYGDVAVIDLLREEDEHIIGRLRPWLISCERMDICERIANPLRTPTRS